MAIIFIGLTYVAYTILLRDNVANTCNLFRVTSLFILIKSASGMCVFIDYHPIEANADVATERMQLQGQSYPNTEFCRKPSIDLRIQYAAKKVTLRSVI